MKKEEQPIKIKDFTPSQFMRSRRPYLFSDSEVSEQAILDRSTLEYHLETLTNRKQELDFEHFARKLAEKEICPNILPQTGPTGGGDSKVDSESYPVSPEISDRWYYADPEGRGAATERWAFAFSAKQKWRDKVKSDIKSMAGTGRSYTVAYFITNRFVRDKDRSDVEDKLSKAYGIDVRILDRTWILDKVFINRRENLAIESLKITVPLSSVPRKGPLDLSREAEFKELEAQIEDPDRYNGLGYQLVEDALQAALLARGLGLPRPDIDGRLGRAARLAEKHGTNQQELRCAYNRAWTCFWWYDDFQSFNEAYDVVEELAQGSTQSADIALLQNLWQLLYPSVEKGQIDAKEGRITERTSRLRSELESLQGEQDRLSVVAWARASLLLMRLVQAHADMSELKDILSEFKTILEESRGLLDFPAVQFIEILMEIGENLPSDEAFDEIFESLVDTARRRESSAVSGRMLLRRGTQKLRGEKPYEAIRLLGRAQQDLALHESRGGMAAALGLCGAAYERVGLLWAARGSVLLATNQALKKFWDCGEISVQALACLRKLIWIELQLGRIPWVLAWIETFLTLSSATKPDEDRQKSLEEEWVHLDGALGFLILKASLFDLKRLATLPHVLEKLQLDASRMALLYALGYDDHLRSEGSIPEEKDSEAVGKFFAAWRNQPGLQDLPDPELMDRQTVELHSKLLGCDISVSVSNENPGLFLAEAVLAGLEGFLATSLDALLMPNSSKVHIRFVARDFLNDALEFEVVQEPNTVVEVRHRRDEQLFDNSETTKNKFVELIGTITAYIATPPDDGEAFFETLIGEEQGLGRALLVSNIRTVVGNILGDKPKIRTSDWNADDQSFPLRRTQAWNHGMPQSSEDAAETVRPTPGEGIPPPELLNVERISHRDRKVFSLINIDLWNKAKWTGTGYITAEDPNQPPFLMLTFKNPEAATQIFLGWKEEIGSEDVREHLRVSIVTGINRKNPAAYRVLISVNPDYSESDRVRHFVIVSRINYMNPTDSINLDRFLKDYNKKKKYILVPAQSGPNGVGGWAPELGILKSELNVRPGWEIGEHDPDRIGIDADDDVIIPAAVNDAPVLRVLDDKKRRKGQVWMGPGRAKPVARSRKRIGRNDP